MDLIFGVFGSAAEQIVSLFFILFGIAVAFLVGRFFFKFLKEWWLDEVQDRYAAGITYVLLELKFPKTNMTFPKGMEQVFANFYQVYSFGIKPEKKWLEGQFEEKFSVEMVSSRDGIRFFVRVNKNYRQLVETAVFSQYPDVEISECEKDYVDEFPKDLPNEEYDIMGTDMILGRDSVYPIRTYPYFFGERKFEEMEIDPISALAEAMSELKTDEKIWIQILISPAGTDLKKAADKVIAKMTGKKEEKKESGLIPGTFEFAKNLVAAPVRPPEWSSASVSEDKPKSLGPIESEIVKAIDRKSSKLAFETMIRLVYIDKRNDFTKSNFSTIVSTFQQFNTQNLNFLRPASLTYTKSNRFFFKKSGLVKKKERVYSHYIQRSFSTLTNVEAMFKKYVPTYFMNIEELATIFHPPITKVSATGLRSIDTKKGAPPSNLPIESL